MAKHLLTGCLFVWIIQASSQLYSQEIDYFSLSPEELFNATVTSAAKTEAIWWDTPAAIYVLSNEDIIRSGASSLPEVLRLVPGVNVAQVNTSTWAVSIRGFNNTLANKLLVLIDGREVYNPLFSGVYWNVQDTLLHDIDRIEIVRGPGAVLWGANAVNGIINIITKKAEESQDSLVDILHGNQEAATLSARYGAAMGDTGHYRIYAKYLNRNTQDTVTGTDADDDWQAYRAGFRIDWVDSSSQDSFTLQGDTYFDRSNRYTTTSSLTSPYNVSTIETVDSRGWNFLSRWHSTNSQGGKFTLQSYLDYTLREQLLLDDKRISFDIDGQYEFPALSQHSVIVGGRYRYTQDNLEGPPSISFSPDSRSDHLFSAFIQDRIILAPKKWLLTIGSKFDHNDYSGFEIQPNVRLQWHPLFNRMAWASLSRAVRTPSRLEHDLSLNSSVTPPSSANPYPIQAVFVANRNFDSEELLAYELGYRQLWGSSVTLDITAFYNDYQDLSTITLEATQFVSNGNDPDHIVLPFSLANNTTANTYGFETTLQWQPNPQLKMTASYSQLTLDLQVPPGSQLNLKAAEGQSPRRQATLRSQWNLTGRASFDTTLYYVDALPTYQIESYWRLDMRWSWHLKHGMEFHLTGQNLLNDLHREFLSSDNIAATQIKRSVYGQLTWHF